MTPQIEQTLRSFRDPGGSLVRCHGRCVRFVTRAGQADFEAFRSSHAISHFVLDGAVVRTEILAECPPEVAELYELAGDEIIAEHESIPFPNYPHEWPPEMLHAAGVLTLDLAETVLRDGLGLKDATPHNVMFRGPNPVFLDVLSFERRTPEDPIWVASAQFERTFILPLLAAQRLGIRNTDVFLSRRDGLDPETVYGWLSPVRRVRQPWLGTVSIPTWLSHKRGSDDPGIYKRRHFRDKERARFVLTHTLRRLRRQLEKAAPSAERHSFWSEYMRGNNNYTEAQFADKDRFVADAIREAAPDWVLDVGCNDGYFSRIAARAGAKVVAIDLDPTVAGNVWRLANAEELDILPLVVDFSRPSPAVGWRNRECDSFLQRCQRRFDFVLMLAVLHHMIVTERIPADEVLRCAAAVTRDFLLIEWVGPEDSMFRRLARGRDELYRNFTHEYFERVCSEHFHIVRASAAEKSARRLYLLRKKGA